MQVKRRIIADDYIDDVEIGVRLDNKKLDAILHHNETSNSIAPWGREQNARGTVCRLLIFDS
jgi:hypothetical protein